MSFLSVTIVSAALLGVGPNGVPSESPATESASSAERSVLVVSQEEVEPTSCDPVINPCSTGCESSNGCQTAYACDGDHCHSGRGWCRWCPWGHDDDCEPNCWNRHVINNCIGPGDFYPHYPYLPVNHGYYYFRPYNFEHVYRDAATAGQMGGDPRAPYSVQFLKRYFAPTPIEQVPISGMEAQLPLLEDLLGPERPAVPKKAPMPIIPDAIPAPAPDQPQPINPAPAETSQATIYESF